MARCSVRRPHGGAPLSRSVTISPTDA